MADSPQTVSIPESVPRLKTVLADLARHPALSPLSTGVMIELPCCGGRVDAEALDVSHDGPSRVFWPPRWTCLDCLQSFTPNITGDGLEECEHSLGRAA
jgi:hypothetical protein